jgi:hypothetical protein
VKRGHFEDLSLDGRIKLQRVFKKSGKGVEWIDLAEVRGRWWDIVKAMMKLRLP